MVQPVLEGFLPDISEVKAAYNEFALKHGYPPTHMLMSHDNFDGFVWALTVHDATGSFRSMFRPLKLKYVWAEDFKNGEFAFSDGQGISGDIETLVIKEK